MAAPPSPDQRAHRALLAECSSVRWMKSWIDRRPLPASTSSGRRFFQSNRLSHGRPHRPARRTLAMVPRPPSSKKAANQLRAPLAGCKWNGAVTRVQFDAAREERADAFIVAVPHTNIATCFLMIQAPGLAFRISRCQELADHWRPSLVRSRGHDQAVRHPAGYHTQWIFNKTALYAPLNGADKNRPRVSTCNL